MYYQIKRLTLLFFLLNATFSYAQFEKQTLLQADSAEVVNSENYRSIAFLDADQDGDEDIVGEVVSSPAFTPININFNSLLEDNAQGWNNLQQSPQANTSIALIDAQAEATGVTLTLKTNWNGAGQRGYDDDRRGFYPRAVTRSYYFTNGTEEITISGLDPSQTYKFSFYGSSFFEGERSAVYRIGSQQAELNASFNTNSIVTISNVTPSSAGVVTLEVAKKAGSDFAFLGAMVIELNRLEPQQYKLLTNNGRTPFAPGLVIDEAANWSFGKVADLNQDNYPDIVAYDTEEQQLLWYENQDGVSFSRKAVSSGDISYISEDQVFILDIDQDNAPDILIKEGNQLYWYKQTNDAFAERALWAEGGKTDLADAPVVRGDIDGDNIPDIVWHNNQQLYFLTSQDAYSLNDSTKVVGVDSPIALSVTDMNGDEKADIVITEEYNWTGSYRIGYLANSEGGLVGTPVFLPINEPNWLNLRPHRLLADDIDQDGDLDFYIYLTPEAGGIFPAQTGWLENQGNWQSTQYHALSNAEAQWTDIDQDGDQDLISNADNSTGIDWLENAKSAWDSTVYQSVNRPVLDKIIHVVAERTNDALTGLAVQSTHYVAEVTLQQGNILPPQIQTKLNTATASFTQADINADGIAELFVTDVNAEGFTVVRWKNSASGLIQEFATHRGTPNSNSIFALESGLLFAPINEAGDRYGWWKLTTGRFVRVGTIEGKVTQLVDINADGTIDVLTDSGWYRNVSNTQLVQNTTAKGNYATDMDGDGDVDIVEAPEAGIKTWYVNNGNGSFTSKTFDIGSEKVLAFADLNNDDVADVIQSSTNGLIWRTHTDGNGTFGASIIIDNFAASHIKALDMDADGDIDLIAHNQKVIIKYRNTLQRQENTEPKVQQAIEDQVTKTDTIYQFMIPDSAFKDDDTGDVLTYSAQLSNEDVLPTWLTFTSASRTFAGTPALSDTGTVTIQIQVADLEGATATQEFDLLVVVGDSTKLGDGGEEPPNPITGIIDEPNSALILYPNPVEQGQAIIIKNLPVYGFTEGRLYSTQGKELMNIKRGSRQIDSSSLTSGVYLLELRGGQHIYRRRIIVK